MEDSITGGALATYIAVPILLVICILAIVWGLKTASINKIKGGAVDHLIAGRMAWIVGAFVGVFTIAITWWAMYPWSYEYHHWVVKTGTVATVDSRIVPAGEQSIEQKLVVRFVGQDQQYGVLDTRAAGLKAGDQLTITCVRIYQWAGTDGYDCNFVNFKPAQR